VSGFSSSPISADAPDAGTGPCSVIGRDEATEEFMVLAGLARSAQWYRNLKARPALEVAVSRRGFQADHHELGHREAELVLTRTRATTDGLPRFSIEY
jgi:hypothetical protein